MDRASFLKRALGAAGLGALVAAGVEVPKEVIAPAKGVAQISPLHDNKQWVIEIGFKNAIRGNEQAYPLLAEAIEHMQPAYNSKIEWLTKSEIEAKRFGPTPPRNDFNHTQIFRTPYTISNTEISRMDYSKTKVLTKLRNEALHRHLGDIEQAIRYGKRQVIYQEGGDFSYPSVRTMGGIKTFEAGTPKLMVLRDLAILTNRQESDYDGYKEEFLSEVSLMVRR